MGVRLTSTDNRVAFFDSTSGLAFGPVMEDDDEALALLAYIEEEYGCDPRELRPNELEEAYGVVVKRLEATREA